MGIKSFAARQLAGVLAPQIYKEQSNAIDIQQRLLENLLAVGAKTKFGRTHHLHKNMEPSQFQQQVPICDYEGFTEYIDQIADGEPDVLWRGKPLYFCKSSGTTSGTKYIPVSAAQISDMVRAARNSLMLYVAETGKAQFFDRKMIFLQGSPVLEKHGEIAAGRLSGIVYHHVPFYARASRMPSYEINCIEDWEEKVTAIAKETLHQPMSLISGIPPWVVMYFEKLRELSSKDLIKDIFPNFELFAFGGVNYEPYRHKIESMVGFKIPSVETYPASEGFIAYQDSQQHEGMLLNVNGGIFFEFVELSKIHNTNPERLTLKDVEIGVNYALILTTNAGLWAYSIGDTVKFVSKNPYRIVVTGRIKHFISAFGEHVISEEVEFSLRHAMLDMHCSVTEFTVAPQVTPPDGTAPYHEWFVEFSKLPHSINQFAGMLDEYMKAKNSYYRDLREGHVLQQLKVRAVPAGTFASYMKSIGKLGGQNKVPRLKNDREIANALMQLLNADKG
ncbi:MAG: GH3 auxin-responsive promoter family protein [Chitinophagales bacterium]|nr:GH3 auxin-responsive promoter family protein [Chitinophagales bacterium]